MADESLGTPVSPTAPDDSGSASPTFVPDTQPDGAGPVDTSSGTDERLKALQGELEDYKKRFSGSTQSWQAEKKAREELEAKINNWRKHGVDPDEIDRAIALANGGNSGTQNTGQAAKGLTPEEVDQRVEMRMIRQDWNSKVDSYFEAHAELDTPASRRFFESTGIELANRELQEAGRVTSTAKDIFKKTVSEWNKLETAIEKKVAAKLTETRTKVAGQGVTETSHVKTPVERGGDEDKSETKEQYAARLRGEQRRLRGLA